MLDKDFLLADVPFYIMRDGRKAMIRTIRRETPEPQNHIYFSPYHITETIQSLL
jgi:hypothetical protein